MEDTALMARPDDDHERRTEALRRVLDKVRLEPDDEHPCTYLRGRTARQVLVRPPSFAPGLYHAFMDLNFRRLGFLVYRTACRGCAECRMLRVLADEFVPTRAQRRCRARNADLRVTVGPPRGTDEKRELYRRYLESRHDGTMSGSSDELAAFLYDAPPFTVELAYRAGERLVAVGIADVEPRAMSAVYCYFDPAETRRSPGVFNVLSLVDECRKRGLPYLYLGYYVAGSRKMAYKADYAPHEVLRADGGWERGHPGRGGVARPPGSGPDLPA